MTAVRSTILFSAVAAVGLSVSTASALPLSASTSSTAGGYAGLVAAYALTPGTTWTGDYTGTDYDTGAHYEDHTFSIGTSNSSGSQLSGQIYSKSSAAVSGTVPTSLNSAVAYGGSSAVQLEVTVSQGAAKHTVIGVASKNASLYYGGNSPVTGSNTNFGVLSSIGHSGAGGPYLAKSDAQAYWTGQTSANGQSVLFFSVWDATLSPAGPGDIDGDGHIDAMDIQLSANAAGGQFDGIASSAFDFNGDSSVTMADHDYLVSNILGKQMGDINLDGHVNFDDLIILAQHYNKIGPWAWGDFNGDWQVNFDDQTLLAQNYEDDEGQRSGGFAADWARAEALVPEPTMLAALALGLFVPTQRRRR